LNHAAKPRGLLDFVFELACVLRIEIAGMSAGRWTIQLSGAAIEYVVR